MADGEVKVRRRPKWAEPGVKKLIEAIKADLDLKDDDTVEIDDRHDKYAGYSITRVCVTLSYPDCRSKAWSIRHLKAMPLMEAMREFVLIYGPGVNLGIADGSQRNAERVARARLASIMRSLLLFEHPPDAVDDSYTENLKYGYKRYRLRSTVKIPIGSDEEVEAWLRMAFYKRLLGNTAVFEEAKDDG